MEIQKSTGIILSSKLYGDADILCKIFTKEYGKRKFIFKGLKKSKKRPQTAAEPGTTVNLVYYFHDKKDSYIVNELNISNHYLEIRKNLQKIFNLYFVLETIEKTIGYDDVNIPVYNLLSAGIDALAQTDYPVNLSGFFTIHQLRLHGILPDLKNCKICGTNEFSQFSFDITDLSPICYKCTKKRERILDPCLKEFILVSLKQKFFSIEHSNFDESKTLNLLFYLSLFIENYYNIEIKSKNFILSDRFNF